MKLLFADAARNQIIRVLWRDQSQEDFKRVDVTPGHTGDDLEALEGSSKLVTHLRRERDPWLIKAKMEEVRSMTGKLACEACGFDFKETYGDLGDAICEVHHRHPLAKGQRTTAMRDLAILCANCHRVVHRSEWMPSVEQLKDRLGRKRGEAQT